MSVLAGASCVATDVDGTLTGRDGRLTVAVVAAVADLAAAGVTVVAVTGRSAGWGQALAAYLPGLAGVVAENGAVWCGPTGPTLLLDPSPPLAPLAVADEVVARLVVETGAPAGDDNAFRLTDRTICVTPELSEGRVADEAARAGLAHTWSTVHHHLSVASMTKRSGLLAVLPTLGVAPADVVAVGDSANDTPLLEPPVPWRASVAVGDGVTAQWRSRAEGAEAFCALAASVGTARRA